MACKKFAKNVQGLDKGFLDVCQARIYVQRIFYLSTGDFPCPTKNLIDENVFSGSLLAMVPNVLFTRVSSNAKTGPIPVSMSVKSTCPDVCPLKQKGCYASGGPINLHWLRLSNGVNKGISWEAFCDEISRLPMGQLWRHNQAGDLPGENNTIDSVAMGQLVKANRNRKGFTYTHKPILKGQCDSETLKANRKAIKAANKAGFTVNLSANTLTHADELADSNVGPVVTLLPATQTENTVTPKGRKVVVCPATQREFVSCQTCKLCSVANRSCIVGFPAHGVSVKAANVIASQS
jgi:hypothetical protein